MDGWTIWDYVIFAIAAFAAVTVLARLMRERRDRLLDDLSRGAKRKPAARD